EAMKNGGSVKLQWPSISSSGDARKSSSAGKTKAAEDVAVKELGFDEVLFDKLKKKRLEIATREGLPAYTIFHNSTLEFFTRLRPRTTDAALKIRGVGETKAGKWLAEFIEVIQSSKSGES